MTTDQQHTTEGDRHAAQRAAIYHFFANSMEFPEAAWLTPDYWSFLQTMLTKLGWREEVAALAPFAVTADQLDPLQLEYTRLFINAVPHVIAPPYGSVYLDSDGMLFGPSAEKTKNFYHEQGYDLTGPNDIPDHLALELRFLGLLVEEGKEEAAERFLEQCFRPWFSLFSVRVAREARHPFYRVLVQLIDFFTREENHNDM